MLVLAREGLHFQLFFDISGDPVGCLSGALANKSRYIWGYMGPIPGYIDIWEPIPGNIDIWDPMPGYKF